MLVKKSRFFILLFILLSFITRGFGEFESGLLYRITPSDIMGALAIGFYVLSGRRWFMPIRYWHISFFIIVLFIGGVAGLDFIKSMIEIIIIIFLFLLFMVMIAHFNTASDVLSLITCFAIAGILCSVFGFYDLAAEMTGLPRFFPVRAPGEVLSGFRNAGQAGHYAMIVLSVLIPARTSKIFNFFSAKQQKIVTTSVICMLIFLAITGKIAAYIGFTIGLAGFFLAQRNSKAFFTTIFIVLTFLIIYNNLDKIAPQTAQRIVYKYQTRLHGVITKDESLLDEDAFIGQNIRDALKAFYDFPISGSGIGAFGSYIYSKHEVHSTYFKMIGEAGLLGVIAYGLFMIKFFKNLKYRSRKKPWQEFLYYYFPFLLGCIVSWAYTYHLRKREFWIMAAIITIIHNIIVFEIKRNRKSQLKQIQRGLTLL